METSKLAWVKVQIAEMTSGVFLFKIGDPCYFTADVAIECTHRVGVDIKSP